MGDEGSNFILRRSRNKLKKGTWERCRLGTLRRTLFRAKLERPYKNAVPFLCFLQERSIKC